MMKEDRDHELRQDSIEHEHRQKHQSEYLVQFRGSLYIEALSPEEAIEFAREKDDIWEWIDSWHCEGINKGE